MLPTWFFVALFLGMLGYLCYFTATNRQELFDNSYNTRQQVLQSQNYRGSIYSSDGKILASTQTDSQGKETRQYPYNALFAHTVGYATRGRTGIEALANYYLLDSHISLSKKAANDAAGVKNPGDNVYTTLDTGLQQTASVALGSARGAIVVTEVSTGRVLAMVSKPDFDPNTISTQWEKLSSDTDSSVLLNRAAQGLYPPGSTFKIVTALEYIRENPDTWQDYSFQCTGSFQYGNSKISCYHGSKHGQVDFTKSFAKSCNSSFANIGVSLDKDAFAKTLSTLLFDNSLPTDILSGKSSVYISSSMTDAEMMQAAIGQGKTQITPLHMNLITCAIANGGVLMEPYLIDSVRSADGTLVKSFRPKTYGSLMSEAEASILSGLMTEVVESGTATKLKNNTYAAAGKTGSAEYDSKGDSHAWFTGFAPAEDPKIAVTVIVEGGGSGGETAVPIARKIFNAYFQ